MMLVPTQTSHQQRVKNELIEVGMTKHGLMKSSSQYLYTIIHDDEHIKAVAYGIYGSHGPIMVATDRRIIYLSHKPSYTTCDEIAYTFVSGVTLSSSGLFGNLSLRSRGQTYTMPYVNQHAAAAFVRYVESRDLGYQLGDTSPQPPHEPQTVQFEGGDPATLEFLRSHDVGVLSTIDRTGNVHGAMVYYLLGDDHELYLLTRAETTKARNILVHQQVAMTIGDEAVASTVQLEGNAEVVADELIKSAVFSRMTKPRSYKRGKHLPPVTSLQDGVYVIVRIVPTKLNFRDYQADADTAGA